MTKGIDSVILATEENELRKVFSWYCLTVCPINIICTQSVVHNEIVIFCCHYKKETLHTELNQNIIERENERSNQNHTENLWDEMEIAKNSEMRKRKWKKTQKSKWSLVDCDSVGVATNSSAATMNRVTLFLEAFTMLQPLTVFMLFSSPDCFSSSNCRIHLLWLNHARYTTEQKNKTEQPCIDMCGSLFISLPLFFYSMKCGLKIG